jgi:hypothetical protein
MISARFRVRANARPGMTRRVERPLAMRQLKRALIYFTSSQLALLQRLSCI